MAPSQVCSNGAQKSIFQFLANFFLLFLQTSSSLKPLVRLAPDFTGMFLGRSFIKFVQMVLKNQIFNFLGFFSIFFGNFSLKSSSLKPLVRLTPYLAGTLLGRVLLRFVQIVLKNRFFNFLWIFFIFCQKYFWKSPMIKPMVLMASNLTVAFLERSLLIFVQILLEKTFCQFSMNFFIFFDKFFFKKSSCLELLVQSTSYLTGTFSKRHLHKIV